MNERKSNLELLRIIAILMIITIHYLLYMMNNDFNNLNSFSQTQNFYLVPLLESLFIIGVNLFILITGYFMVEKETVNIKKIIKLILSTIFYSFIILIVSSRVSYVNLSIKEIIKAIGSILIYPEYWFVKCYTVLFFLIPFINIGLKRMNKKTYQSLILVILIFFSLCNSILPLNFYSSLGYDAIHLICIYCIGGYIRLHFKSDKKYIWLIGYFVFSIITFIMTRYCYLGIYTVWAYNYIFNILSSICLFIFFTKIHIQSKIINIIASSVFGIYLIHINQFVAPIIYKGVGAYWNSNMFIPNLIFRVICIFIGCSAIELIKEFIFDKTVYKIIDKIKLFNIKIGNID